MFKEADLICWGIMKPKILYKISGTKISNLKLKINDCIVQTPSMKGLKRIGEGGGGLHTFMGPPTFKDLLLLLLFIQGWAISFVNSISAAFNN